MLHYNAFALTLCILAALALDVPLLQFYDDFISPGRGDDVTLRDDTITFLSDLLGTDFNPEKTEVGQSVGHLGTRVILSHKGTKVVV